MTQFYETRMGQNFFIYQFPKMIDDLTRIANVMEKSSQSTVKIPVEVPDDFLEQLYFGNLEPDAEITGDDLKDYLEESIQRQNDLQVQLAESQWEMVEELLALHEKRKGRETVMGFTTGFRLAMQMMIAGMKPLAQSDHASNSERS